MKTFSSTLNRGGKTLSQTNTASSSAFEILKNSFNQALNSSAAIGTTGKDMDTEGINYDEDLNIKEKLYDLDVSAPINTQLPKTQIGVISQNDIENPFHLGSEVYKITNKYRGYYNKSLIGFSGSVFENDSNGNKKNAYTNIVEQIGSPSLFNPYFAVDALGITDNIPLLDNTKEGTTFTSVSPLKNDNNSSMSVSQQYDDVDISDCSIKHLVELSKVPISILGQARYKYSDFMYCQDVGKISNNHMLTLRRFASPVKDNIFRNSARIDDALEMSGDIGRMITWFDNDDNKLDSILNFKFSASWKELNSKINTNSSNAEGNDGPLNNLLNTANPLFNKQVGSGTGNPSRWESDIIGGGLKKIGLKQFSSRTINSPYTAADSPMMYGSMPDKNYVYEPKDTLRSTNIYEGKLEFANEFNIVFKYKLRGYNGINPKSAFLDLIGNILQVTYRKGTFWPGENRLLGQPQNITGFKKAYKFIESTWDFAGSMLQGLMSGNADSDMLKSEFSNIMSSLNDNSIMNSIKNIAGEFKEGGLSGGMQALFDQIKDDPLGMGNALKGMIKTGIGRPQVYAWDSLLSSDATGLWHLTIGNPLNPIAVMGNLILTNTEMQQSGPLGFDDFPTELKVTVTLKHAMPRDAVDISKMYTKGASAIYIPVPNSSGYVQGINDTNVATAMEGYDKTHSASKLQAGGSNGKMPLNETSANSKYGSNAQIEARNDYLQQVTETAIKTEKISEYAEEYIGWIGDYSAARIQSNRESLK